MGRKVLHFTIGPVQGFINDARRLRDYWAGSFLLSLLAGHAMRAVTEADGTVVFPNVFGDPLFLALTGKEKAPYIGSLPNRFKAEVPAERASQIARECAEAVSGAWIEICDAIWDAYFENAAKDSAENGAAASRIWQRQTGNFWTTAWVVGDVQDDGSDGAWLDLRKNWRTHFPACVEDGDHCRLMGQYQELSGFHRIGERSKQQLFWESVRAQLSDLSLDISPAEPLCAIAAVKRLFPVLAAKRGGIGKALPFCPGRGVLNIRSWPSTSYIAASPWLRSIDLREQATAEEARKFANQVKGTFPKTALSEWESPSLLALPEKNDLFRMDGHLLHEDAIAGTVKDYEKRTGTTLETGAASDLQHGIRNLYRTVGSRPSEFYAILRMDGDRIGASLREHPDVIKSALAKFTSDVSEAFDPHSAKAIRGVLVYAGGDDVLAVLPAEDAVQAALKLQKIYASAFSEFTLHREKFTLSASIVFSHFKRTPLSAALRKSTHYLDVVAKEQNGRNSLAIAVLKPGGVQSEWVCAFEENDGLIASLDELAKLGLGIAGNAGLAGGFFHSIESKYGALFKSEGGMEMQGILEPLIAHQLKLQFGNEKVEKLSPDLHDKICSIYKPLNGSSSQRAGAVSFGAGQVIRFLSSDGSISEISSVSREKL